MTVLRTMPLLQMPMGVSGCQVYVDVEKDVLERQLEQEDSSSTTSEATKMVDVAMA